jgi:hypothetical protein
MIPPTIEIVSYTSIIHMILLYDTPHYDQPYFSPSKKILRNLPVDRALLSGGKK